MLIRIARMSDADTAADLLRRSITELCSADHGNDPVAILDWVANKTADNWRLWCANAAAHVLVAEQGGQVVGAAMMTTGGEILLNYVHPEARFQGVSTALMQAMEAMAANAECPHCCLHTTRTAEAFYLSRGYRPVPDAEQGLMTKALEALARPAR